MAITTLRSHADPSIHSVDLPVSLSGLTVTVPAGSVFYRGTPYTLALAEVHTVGTYAVDCEVFGYLVLDTSTSNTLRVFVDEVVQDGVDAHFDFQGSPYELITPLYNLTVPPGTTDLSTLNVYRWVIVPEP